MLGACWPTSGVVWYGNFLCVIVWHFIVLYGMVRHGLVRYGGEHSECLGHADQSQVGLWHGIELRRMRIVLGKAGQPQVWYVMVQYKGGLAECWGHAIQPHVWYGMVWNLGECAECWGRLASLRYGIVWYGTEENMQSLGSSWPASCMATILGN